MDAVQDFILGYPGNEQKIMQYLNHLVMSFPGITGKISYRIPFYYRKSWICYLNLTKNGGVEFAFPRGNELSNEQGLLDSKGRKQVYSVEFFSLDQIPEKILLEIIQETIILDDTIAYASKRMAK